MPTPAFHLAYALCVSPRLLGNAHLELSSPHRVQLCLALTVVYLFGACHPSHSRAKSTPPMFLAGTRQSLKHLMPALDQVPGVGPQLPVSLYNSTRAIIIECSWTRSAPSIVHSPILLIDDFEFLSSKALPSLQAATHVVFGIGAVVACSAVEVLQLTPSVQKRQVVVEVQFPMLGGNAPAVFECMTMLPVLEFYGSPCRC